MCVLMLRGGQTPGELKQRTERMHAFADLASVHETLERLIGRELVRRLDRRPGQKEERYEQLLQGGEEDEATSAYPAPAQEPESVSATSHDAEAAPAAAPPEAAAGSRSEGMELEQLRERVERLEREVAELRSAAQR